MAMLNLPHTGKHYDCVILSKTDSIGFLSQKFKNNGIISSILRKSSSSVCHFSDAIEVLAIALTSMYLLPNDWVSGILRKVEVKILKLPEFFSGKIRIQG